MGYAATTQSYTGKVTLLGAEYLHAASFDRETENLSREEWKRFRDERLPALEDQARRLRKRLEQDGWADEAREFWQDFLRWLKEILSRAPAELR